MSVELRTGVTVAAIDLLGIVRLVAGDGDVSLVPAALDAAGHKLIERRMQHVVAVLRRHQPGGSIVDGIGVVVVVMQNDEIRLPIEILQKEHCIHILRILGSSL